MPYAYIENNQINEIHYFLPKNWRNISNLDCLSDDQLLEYNWYKIIEDPISYDSNTQEIYDSTIIYANNEVHRIMLVRDKIINNTQPPADPPVDEIVIDNLTL